MAKKKSSKQKAPSIKEFSSSPFKSLKGLSALSEPSPPSTNDKASLTTTDVEESTASSVDQHSFSEEMSFLGVKPLSECVVEEPDTVKSAGESAAPPSNLSREENDSSAFLDAVGSMEKTFKDEWPEDEPEKKAVPRRMKQVDRGQVKPECELDLHGLTTDEAGTKVRFFLQDAIYQDFQTVLIITGKGLHSSDGPVLRQAMERLLAQQRELVIEWGIAPRRYGGDGALVVFLRLSDAE